MPLKLGLLCLWYSRKGTNFVKIERRKVSWAGAVTLTLGTESFFLDSFVSQVTVIFSFQCWLDTIQNHLGGVLVGYMSRSGWPVSVSRGNRLDYLNWFGKILLLLVAPFPGQLMLNSVRAEKANWEPAASLLFWLRMVSDARCCAPWYDKLQCPSVSPSKPFLP